MWKQQLMPSDTSIPDALNVFAKKFAQRHSITGEPIGLTVKELLGILLPAHKPSGCFPVINSAGRFNDASSNTQITVGHLTGGIRRRKVDESIKKIFNSVEDRAGEEEESETQCSCSLNDDMDLSFDGKWLRKCFKSPLRMALKEILSRKPCDPVGYLGFWLLNYRRCQEINRLHFEQDNELKYYRSLVEEPISKGEELSVDRGEEEEVETRDWNFKHYETAHTSK